MKRHWRPGRIALALLLGLIAAILFVLWPIQPRWQIHGKEESGYKLPVGEILGYLPQKQLLLTYPAGTMHPFELHGWDIASGDLKFSVPFKPLKAKIDNNDGAVLLTPNGKYLLLVDTTRGFVEVFELETARIIHNLEGKTPIYKAGISQDSAWFICRSRDTIFVWDIEAGSLIKEIKLPTASLPARNYADQYHAGGLQLSDNGEYMAVEVYWKSMSIVRMDDGKELMRSLPGQHSWFLDGGKGILILSVPDVKQKVAVKWLQMYDDRYDVLRDGINGKPIDGTVLCVGDQCLVTGQVQEKKLSPEWLDKLPVTVKQFVIERFGLERISAEISCWDIRTGTLRHRFMVPIEDSENFNTYWEIKTHNWMSLDGRLLAVNDGKSITLWDIPPRSSSTCWLVCSSFAILALWLAMPRKEKVT